MNSEIAIARKLDKVASLLIEIQALLNHPEEKQDHKRSEFLVDPGLLAKSYPVDDPCVRWITCAQVCKELGITPSRGACSSVGVSLKHLGFRSRRSSGKKLIHLPVISETF